MDIQKVLKEMSVAMVDVFDLPDHGEVLDDWYVHLFFYNKRKH